MALHQSRLLLHEIQNQNMLYCDPLSSPHATSTLAWRSDLTSRSSKLHDNEFSSLSRINTNPHRKAQTKAVLIQQSEGETPIYHPGPVHPASYSTPKRSIYDEQRYMCEGGTAANIMQTNSKIPKSTLEIRSMIKRLRRERESHNQDENRWEQGMGGTSVESLAPTMVETPQQAIPSKISAFPPSSPASVQGQDRSMDASTQVSFDAGGPAAPRQLALVASLAAATAFGLCLAARQEATGEIGEEN